MKKYFLVLVFILSFGALYSMEINGSSFEYNAKFSDGDNYSEKDGEGVLKLNMGNLSLKYSAEVLNNATKGDTSIEAIYGKTLNNRVKVSLDTTIDTGVGFEFKLDDDSDKTYLKIGLTENIILGLYPFNFGSTVGDEFSTEDVSKIYYISGRPTYINGSSQGVNLGSKTIPGMILTGKLNRMLSVYGGIGAVEFDIPTVKNLDLTEEMRAQYWEKRIAVAYKAGLEYNNEVSALNVDFISQDESEQGGSLLKYALSTKLSLEPGNLRINAEAVYAQAGEKPYYTENDYLSREYGYEPYYTQDWVNEADFAAMVKLAYEVTPSLLPYVSGKHYGENFIYDGENSAHKLRTLKEFTPGFNDSESHGGLNVVEAGIEYIYCNAIITPFVEYKMAENAVFSPESDLTAKDDKRVGDLEKTCTTFGMNIKYKF